MSEHTLASWNDGPTRQSILDFVAAADDLPVEQRVAVFDNDGTLWCEKPSYTQLLFMLGELHRAVAADATVGERSEYRALLDDDKAKQAELGLPAIAMALVELCAGITAAEFERRVLAFFESARHPTLDVPLKQLRYQPMLELVDLLREHDFSVFIVTGGGTEFVRAISNDFYGVAPERVVGSMIGYEVQRDDQDRPHPIRTKTMFGEVDEGDAKVSNLQMGLGRRPIFAAGNTPGDASMMEYARTSDGPTLALLVDHDDADREFAYEGKAASFDSAGSFVDAGRDLGWTIASMRDDWSQIFPAS
ncbi:HAD family hydrolase [Ilumatobacter nonamiensis]|uniref:HAD family hydrolase n=1 Tax=Ilumatobacter nonamiensis TaxID=467093 RepID=UPI0003456F1C|nr:HAD family hydrolase [Ilumatobacter nonamiensis]